jgi:hypothetical protein
VSGALKAVLAALGFVGTVLALHAFAPKVRDDEGEFEQMAKYCEVLFVGPSYVRSQVFPAVVDAEADRLGKPFRSCKFARTAMYGYEQKWELDRLLSHSWPKLRLVVFDVTTGDKTGVKRENLFNPRVIQWHDVGQLSWFAERADRSDDRAAVFFEAVEHVEHFVAHQLLLGQGAVHLQQAGETEEERLEKLLRRGRNPPRPTKADRRKNIGRVKQAAKKKQKVLADKPADKDLTRWALELRELVRAHGVEGQALLAPVWGARLVRSEPAEGVDPMVVHDFNDPGRYPQLYDIDARGWGSHLNESGSYEYSKLLAKSVAKHLPE